MVGLKEKKENMNANNDMIFLENAKGNCIMGAKSKRKGKNYELEIAGILKEQGYDCRRTSQYCGNTEESSDVIGLEGIHIECKRYASKGWNYEWMEQAKRDAKEGNLPAVFHRTDRHENLVTMTLKDWLFLYNSMFTERKFSV